MSAGHAQACSAQNEKKREFGEKTARHIEINFVYSD